MGSFICHVTFDCTDPARMADFWSEVTGYRREEISSDEVVSLHAPDERGVRRLLFFRVPEPKSVKNRVHVDLAARDPEAEIERLTSLGATRVDDRHNDLGASWTVMLDPEGNEFCLG